MIGQADVADHSLFLGLQRGFIQAGAVAGLGAEGGVVELVQVDVLSAQVPEGGVQVLPEILCVLGGGLGSNIDLAADALEGLAQLHLAVGVGAGGVEEADAGLVGLAGQMHRVFL